MIENILLLYLNLAKKTIKEIHKSINSYEKLIMINDIICDFFDEDVILKKYKDSGVIEKLLVYPLKKLTEKLQSIEINDALSPRLKGIITCERKF